MDTKTINKWIIGAGVATVILFLCSIIYFYITLTCLDLTHKKADENWLKLRKDLMTKSQYKYDYSDSISEFTSINYYPFYSASDSLFFDQLTKKSLPHRSIYTKTIIPVDTIYNIDSLLTQEDLQTILMMQQTILSRQNLLVDDIRQETNNTINKMNGWLALWLGVMAIIGVFVPIALQFKLTEDSRKEIENIKNKFDTETISIKHKFDAYTENIKSSFKQSEDNHKKELEQLLAESRRNILEHNFARVVATSRNIHHIIDNKEYKDQVWRKAILQDNWSDIIGLLKLYIEAFVDDKELRVSSYKMSMVLLQISDAIRVVMQDNRTRSRRLINLRDKIHTLIEKLNTPFIERSKIYTDLKSINQELHDLSKIIFP